MAGSGRGRILYSDRNVPLRRPNEATSLTASLNLFINNLSSLNIDEFNASLDANEKKFYSLSTSKENLILVLKKMHEAALNDPVMGYKVAKLMGKVADWKGINGVSVRNEFFSLLQQDFEKRRDYETDDRQQYFNAIILLSEVVETIRICGQPLDVLCKALINYLSELKENLQSDALQILLQVLAVNWQSLETISSVDLQKLCASIRETLLDPTIKLSTRSQRMLVLAIDLTAANFKMPYGIIRDVYVRALGNSYECLEDRAVGRIRMIDAIDSSNDEKEEPTYVINKMRDDNTLREAVRMRMREKGLLQTAGPGEKKFGPRMLISTKMGTTNDGSNVPLPTEENSDW